MSKYGVFSGPYFPVFRPNTEIYCINISIQSENGKIRTRNNSVFGHVSQSGTVPKSWDIAVLFFARNVWFIVVKGKLRTCDYISLAVVLLVHFISPLREHLFSSIVCIHVLTFPFSILRFIHGIKLKFVAKMTFHLWNNDDWWCSNKNLPFSFCVFALKSWHWRA